jgi:hypothetical protein
MRKIATMVVAVLLCSCILGCNGGGVGAEGSEGGNTMPSAGAEEGTKEIQMKNNTFQVRPNTVRFVAVTIWMWPILPMVFTMWPQVSCSIVKPPH